MEETHSANNPLTENEAVQNFETLPTDANEILTNQPDATEEANVKISPKTRIIKQIISYALAPVASLTFFVVFLIILGIYPFGQSVMSSYDLLAQIAPFAEHLFDVFEGKSSLFYSLSIAGGADTFGTLAYCMISPFSFIFLLGGKGMVNYMVPFVLGAKIIAISLSATFFIKKLFPKVHPIATAIISVLYTYSGYMHVANTYINWLDFLIYLPLVMVAFKRFMQTGKYLAFSLSISACIYACFSIACFSLLIIFLIIIAYVFFCVGKDERKERITKICMALIISIAITLPVILPALKAYLGSGRNTGLFGNLDKPLDATHLYNKISYVIVDAVFFAFNLWYFITCDKKQGLNKFLMVTAGLIFAPVLIDEVCLLLNAGSYMSYALRFGFLNSVLTLYVTTKTVSEVEVVKEKFSKKWLISSIIAIILVALCAFVLYSLNDIIAYGKDSFVFKSIIKENTIFYDMFKEADFSKHFSSKFAHSIGGLEILVFLFIAVSLSTLAIIILKKLNVMPVRVGAIAIACLALLQAGFASFHMVRGNKNTMITYEQIQTVLDDISVREDGDFSNFRIKDYNDKVTANAPLTLHYKSYSVFSSVIHSNHFKVTSFFDYSGNGVNSAKSRNGNIFSDCLLGYKYTFSTSNGLSVGIWRRLAEHDTFNLFENKYVFPSAFTIPVGEYDIDKGNYAEKMDSLYNYLGGEGELTAKRPPQSIVYNEELDYYTVTLYSQANCEGNTYIVANLPDGVSARYTNGTVYEPEDSKVMNNDFHLSTGYTKSTNYRTISIKATKGTLTKEILSDCIFTATVSLKKVIELSEIAWENAVDVTFKANGLTAEVNGLTKDKLLFVNCIDADGYDYKVNGNSVDSVKNDFNFMAVPVGADTESIDFTYTSPFIKFILLGIVLGGIIVAGMILAFRYYKKLKKAFEIVAPICALTLGFGIFGFGFFYPIVLFITKCITAIF